MRFQLSIAVALFLLTAPWCPVAAGPSANGSPISIRVDALGCLDEQAGTATVKFAVETTLTDIETWQWTFGDRGVSDLESPEHSYSSVGSFTVSLTVFSTSTGAHTVIENNFVQINDLLLSDNFDDLTEAKKNWRHFDEGLLSDDALFFELMEETEKTPLGGQSNGKIICLGPGGDRPFDLDGESSGRFHLDLEFSDNADPADVSFTALRLLDTVSSVNSFSLADLQVRKLSGRFDVRIFGVNNASDWIRLSNGPSGVRLSVELDWYSPNGPSGVTLEARIIDLEGPGEPVIHVLQVVEQLVFAQNFDALLLGVIELPSAISESAGLMKVDSFRACRFEHRPE